MSSSLVSRRSAGFGVQASVQARGTRVITRSAELPFDASMVVGDKLGRWMKTPFDLLAFGPRASTGALVSAPERLPRLQADVERILELVQDPRPISEKQEVLFKELEDTVLEFLERGADVETDVLANIKTVLPPEVANIMSEIIPGPPSKFVEVPIEPPVGPTTWHKEDVAASQIVSEVTEIKKAVEGLQATLEEIRANADPSRVAMVRLNLREARDLLARRLDEVAIDDTTEPSITAATREARILLDEVNAQFMFN